jgi:hypothetical protein
MPFVLVRIRVSDYGKWKQVMEEHVAKRKELGSKGTRIFRDSEHPDQIVCLTEWGDFAKAREFMNWGDPGEIAARSSRTGSPEVCFLDPLDSLPA